MIRQLPAVLVDLSSKSKLDLMNQLPAISSFPAWAQVTLAAIPVFAAVFAGFGLWLSVIQSRKSNAQVRAKLVAECLQRFCDDRDMQDVFYDIEYAHFMYEEVDFHGTELERKVDKLLLHFSSVALAWRAGLLRVGDLKPLQYIVRRILRDDGIQSYLQFVFEWSSRTNLGEHPFVALAMMGETIERDV